MTVSQWYRWFKGTLHPQTFRKLRDLGLLHGRQGNRDYHVNLSGIKNALEDFERKARERIALNQEVLRQIEGARSAI